MIRKLIERDVRGVAIMTSSLDETVMSPLTDKGIGVVFCNLVSPGRLVSNIRIDYQRGINAAINIERLLRRAEARAPGWYEPHYRLGAVNENEKRYPDAIREMQETVKIEP